MSEQEKEKMLELLSGKIFSDLNEAEKAELAELENLFPELKTDDSFEIAATAVSLTNLDISEPMPARLKAKILADADKYFAAQEKAAAAAQQNGEEQEYQRTFAFEPKRSAVWNWLGWLAAAAASVALAVNLWVTRTQSPQQDISRNATPTPTVAPTPEKLTPAEERERFLASARDAVQTLWTDPKNPQQVLGDIVWSNAEQKGFMRFRGLPANDPNRETYQLWIVDKTQKHPVDGGVFDVAPQTGEIVIPIDAKLRIKEPTQFVVTAEKPGGVVVSDLGKVSAVAKIQT
jgi:hypothetical protein